MNVLRNWHFITNRYIIGSTMFNPFFRKNNPFTFFRIYHQPVLPLKLKLCAFLKRKLILSKVLLRHWIPYSSTFTTFWEQCTMLEHSFMTTFFFPTEINYTCPPPDHQDVRIIAELFHNLKLLAPFWGGQCLALGKHAELKEQTNVLQTRENPMCHPYI